ncbi:MAG: hypothetical protein O3A82_08255 [Verrucomicrobia bacterium]|nr:hypothetical protein [Verrucomicrobiota bacterium]MDA1046903.1 hypothetical protein [Verrucomicrobiota bacterium]
MEKNGLGEETTRSYCSVAGYVSLRVLLSREAMLDHVSVAGRSFSFRDGVESAYLLNAPLIKVMQSGKLPWRQFAEFQGSAWATQPRHGPKSQRFQHYVPHGREPLRRVRTFRMADPESGTGIGVGRSRAIPGWGIRRGLTITPDVRRH